jgi:hypothetical protein
MEIKKVSISKLKANVGQLEGIPSNPRCLKNQKFYDLVESIKEDPGFLEFKALHTLEHNKGFVVLCGNQRLAALKHLKYKQVPIMVYDLETPLDIIRGRIIKDNTHYGEWDMDDIANQWDEMPVKKWGLDVAYDTSEAKEETKEIKIKLTISPDYSDIEHEVRAELEEMQGKYNGLEVK